uniref:Uncharacterized protein n=1 Tax=Anguilla anguilla TaxID=7936 RepID=A0A0E9UQI1_ANGAN
MELKECHVTLRHVARTDSLYLNDTSGCH